MSDTTIILLCCLGLCLASAAYGNHLTRVSPLRSGTSTAGGILAVFSLLGVAVALTLLALSGGAR